MSESDNIKRLRHEASEACKAAELSARDLDGAIRESFETMNFRAPIFERIMAARLALCRLYVAQHGVDDRTSR